MTTIDKNRSETSPATGEAETETTQSAAVGTSPKSTGGVPKKSRGALAFQAVKESQLRKDVPDFRPGDTVRVHAKIVEGTKERVQIFEGVVIKRHGGLLLNATFTVRKVSYNIGVERTFMVHSPRIDKIEVLTSGSVRRARLFYLRDLRGKASRIKTNAPEHSDVEEPSEKGSKDSSARSTPSVQQAAQ